MPSRDYPATVVEVLVDGMKFKPEALRALRAFRQSKPWRGNLRERMDKLAILHQALCEAYGIPRPRLQFVQIAESGRGNGFYDRADHSIGLVNKLSVVTYLHEFAHARGFGERGACRWSINLFRRMFPRSFAHCTFEGHMVINNRRGV